MDIDALQPSFVCIQFERVDREKNVYRYYYLGWEQTLLDRGAMVRRMSCAAPLPAISWTPALTW